MYHINKNNRVVISLLIICLFCIQITLAQCTGSSCSGGTGSCGMASSTSGSCGSSCGMSAKGSGCGSGMSCGSQNTTSSMSCCGSSPQNTSMANGCGSGSCGSNGGCGGMSSCGAPDQVTLFTMTRMDKDNGPWAFAYLAQRYKTSITTQKVTQQIPDYDAGKGISMRDMAQVANKLGLVAKGYKMPYEELFKHPLPVIIYFPDHIAVLTALDKKKNILTFTDSTKKKITLTKEEFLKQWEGYVLELQKQSTISLAE